MVEPQQTTGGGGREARRADVCPAQ